MRKILKGFALKEDLEKERVVEKYLIFPKSLNHELRWLEKVKIRQRICEVDVGGSMEWGNYKYCWKDIKWED